SAENLAVLPAPTAPVWDHVPREPHLLDYLIILRKHQWLILTFLVTVVTVVTIASFKMKPVYEATAQVEVDRDSQTAQPFQDGNVYDQYVDTDTYIETQTKILQSETLALQTIRTLDLGRYPEFGGSSQMVTLPRKGTVSKRPAILGAFLSQLSVKRVPNSRLIEVGFEAEDPQLAALVVNTHVQNYEDQNFRSKYDATTEASKRLSGSLEELEIKMEKSENARIAYERQHQIWQTSEKQDIATQKLADLSKAVTDAQTDLATREALDRMAMSGNIDALPQARDNGVIQNLLSKKSDLDAQYADAINLFGPNYPKVERLAAQEKQIQTDLAQAHKTIIESIQEEYNAARNHVQILEEQLDKQKAEANAEAEKMVEYNILQRDADTNKQLYDSLSQKVKEATITAGLESTNIRLVDPALAPSAPSRPQKTRNIMMGILVGLVGGIGLALFREYLDNTVKSPSDIEALTGLPSLAVVPSLSGTNGNGHRGK